MALDLDDLEAKALAAIGERGGDWGLQQLDVDEWYWDPIRVGPGTSAFDHDDDVLTTNVGMADFIAAASPATMLDLIAALRAERERADRMREALQSRQQYVVVDPMQHASEKLLMAEHDAARKADRG